MADTGIIPVNSFYGPIHIAISWPAGPMGGVDLDIAALAYDANGNQFDVAYFKKPEACAGAIGTMGDNTTGFGYEADKEGIFVHAHLLPQEVQYVFVMVNVRGGADTLATTGAGIKFVDGSEAGGHFITTAPLNMPTEAVLAGVLIRGPPHLYPPGWQLQITTAFPPLSGAGRDFAESVPLVEEYLRSMVPPELLANRPPNNPMEMCDMSKNNSYFLDPSIRMIEVGCGWTTACDLDAHCFLLDEWYQKVDHVYKGDLSSQGVRHSGNDTRGRGNPNMPDEIVYVHLDELLPQVKHIAFFINICQGEEYQVEVRDAEGNVHYETRRHPPPPSFAHVPWTFATMLDSRTQQQLCNFRLSEDNVPGRTRLMCVLSRYGVDSRWQLLPLGTPSEFCRDSAHARKALIHATRPDLLRPIKIDFGVINGRGLKACDKGGTSDPYFSCKFLDGTVKKTEKIKKTVDPDWNHPDLYTWQGPIWHLLERIEIKMDVYDWDRFGSNDFMGRAYLHAKEIIGTRGRGQISKSYTLGPKHAHGGGGMFDKLRGFTGEFPGEVTVCWTCSPAR